MEAAVPWIGRGGVDLDRRLRGPAGMGGPVAVESGLHEPDTTPDGLTVDRAVIGGDRCQCRCR